MFIVGDEVVQKSHLVSPAGGAQWGIHQNWAWTEADSFCHNTVLFVPSLNLNFGISHKHKLNMIWGQKWKLNVGTQLDPRNSDEFTVSGGNQAKKTHITI